MEFNIKVKKDNEFFVSLKDIRSSKTLNISADELKENPEILKNEDAVVRGIKGKIYDSYKSVGIEVFLDDNAQKLVEKIASENAKKVNFSALACSYCYRWGYFRIILWYFYLKNRYIYKTEKIMYNKDVT